MYCIMSVHANKILIRVKLVVEIGIIGKIRGCRWPLRSFIMAVGGCQWPLTSFIMAVTTIRSQLRRHL